MLSPSALAAPAERQPHAEPDAPPDTNTQYLRFALGQDMHAVRIDIVREILELVPMTPLPLMPAFVRGVMNLRGAVVPVIDLAARVGLGPATVGRRSCVVLVDAAGTEPDAKPQPMGVLVDAVHEVFDAGAGDTEPPPRLGTRIPLRFIRSIVRVGDRVATEIDFPAVLDQQALAELIERHAARH
jgi:purine-binding chemotaxis protein CheW